MKKILLVASNFTGHGHKSIAESLMAHFADIPGVDVRFVDGFSLMGKLGIKASKTYGPMTRRMPKVWKMSWTMSDRHDGMTVGTIRFFSQRRFRRLMEEYQPDLILSVHSMYNASVVRMVKKCGLDTPVVTLQADIVNIHKTWCCPDTYRTICPTQEAYDASLERGMPKEKLVRMSFPVRRLFTDYVQSHDLSAYDGQRPLRCLIMSGGEGSGGLMNYAKAILSGIEAEVTVICGRNEKMHKLLTDALVPTYGDRVRILGFVKEMQEEMARADLLIARGSPNSLMEGIMMGLPLIVTGSLPGQEQDNPKFIEDHKLGIVCSDADKMAGVINGMLADDCALYNTIRTAELNYRDPDCAKDIAVYVAGLIPDKR